MISSGETKSKVDLLDACRLLRKNNFEIFATRGTKQFLQENGVESTMVRWADENGENNVVKLICEQKFDLVINVPKNLDSRKLANDYAIRRAAIDFNTPLITNARLASAFITAFCTKSIKDLLIKSWDEY